MGGSIGKMIECQGCGDRIYINDTPVSDNEDLCEWCKVITEYKENK